MNNSSLYMGEVLLNQLIARTFQEAGARQFISKNINGYASNRVFTAVNELTQQLLTVPNELQRMKLQSQPIEIIQDTMMGLTLFEPLSKQNKLQERSLSISPRRERQRVENLSQNSVYIESNRNKSKRQDDRKLHKLEETKEEDKQIDEIRKETENKKKEQMQKINLKARASEFLKLKEGFNYDYDGNLIKLKGNKKNNLVSKFIMSSIDHKEPCKSTPVKKQVTHVEVTKLSEPSNPEKKINSKMKKERQQKMKTLEDRSGVEFSNITNPLDSIQVKNGVKLTFDRTVVEKKTQQLSEKEFKKTMTNRKLSKSEYNRMRSISAAKKSEGLDRNRLNPLEKQKEMEKAKTQMIESPIKAVARSRNSRRFATENTEDRVAVENNDLKKIILQKIESVPKMSLEANAKISRPASSVKKQLLNNIDRFNLQCAKLKHLQYHSQAKNEEKPALPKLQPTKFSQAPKSRERVRDSATLRREVLKKFEQTMRA